MFCPLGRHLLRGDGVFITNSRHIRFVNKFFPDFLPSEKVCAKCKLDIEIAYEYRMKRALVMRVRNDSVISSFSSEESVTADKQKKEANKTTTNDKRHLGSLSSTATNDSLPTTSAQAAAKRQKQPRPPRVQQKNLLAINVQRGARLPHIQPIAKRRQFVHLNPDVMDIYIRGTTGG